MNDTPPTVPQHLAERALQRLRKVATGNGLEPAAITVIDAQENMFALRGKMEVSALSESAPATYPGGVRGKDRKVLRDAAALQEAVARHKQEFRDSPDWVAEVTKELLGHESKGWGLENAKVTLPQKSAVYAATTICPSCDGRKNLTCTQCHGQGSVICTQCQGQGREPCYHCGGSGENSQQPGQRCNTCNGTRFAPCRFCQSRGQLPCPTCGGKRGTPCATCQGTGSLTQEVTVTCGAETHFQLQTEGLPSGLRRGLDRIGIAHVGQGHGDITATPVPKNDDEDAPPASESGKGKFTILNYEVAMPYAEMKIGFGVKKAVVSAVGKRCAISGVPNFLDATLEPWRAKLTLAAQGKGPLEPALEARALRETVALAVAGKGNATELRKLYPFGLSAEVIGAIIDDTRQALNVVTLKTRAAMAGLCVAVCAGLFYFLFMTGLHAQVMRGGAVWVVAAADVAGLGVALAASWAVLNFATRFVLQKRFPQLTVALQQKIGKTGAAMLGGIIAAFVTFIVLSPVKPVWLSAFRF